MWGPGKRELMVTEVRGEGREVVDDAEGGGLTGESSYQLDNETQHRLLLLIAR